MIIASSLHFTHLMGIRTWNILRLENRKLNPSANTEPQHTYVFRLIHEQETCSGSFSCIFNIFMASNFLSPLLKQPIHCHLEINVMVPKYLQLPVDDEHNQLVILKQLPFYHQPELYLKGHKYTCASTSSSKPLSYLATFFSLGLLKTAIFLKTWM